MKFWILALFIPTLLVVVFTESTLSFEKLIRKLRNSKQVKEQDIKEKETFTKGRYSFCTDFIHISHVN